MVDAVANTALAARQAGIFPAQMGYRKKLGANILSLLDSVRSLDTSYGSQAVNVGVLLVDRRRGMQSRVGRRIGAKRQQVGEEKMAAAKKEIYNNNNNDKCMNMALQ